MMFIITTADQTTNIVLDDYRVNNYTSLSLIGYGYVDTNNPSGQIINQNFVNLLENFASSSSPTNPITGQVWFDTNSQSLNLFDKAWELVFLQEDIQSSQYINETFLTEQQILNYSFVTASYVTSQGYVSLNQLNNYISESSLISMNYVNDNTLNTSIDTMLSNYLLITDLSGMLITTSELNNGSYVTGAYLNNFSYVTGSILTNYLTTNQNITFAGDVLGTGNTNITAAVAATGIAPGTYLNVIVNSEGRITTSEALTSSFIIETLGFSPASFKNSSLFETSGYQKFPNGLIIQWIKGTSDNGDDTSPSQTLPWALAFPNSLLGASISTSINASSSDSQLWYQIISTTSTQVVVQRQNISIGNTTQSTPFIIGFGY